MLWTRITQLQKQRNELGDIHFDWRYVADFLVPFAAFCNSGLNETFFAVSASDNFGISDSCRTTKNTPTLRPIDNLGVTEAFSRKISTLLRSFADNIGVQDNASHS